MKNIEKSSEKNIIVHKVHTCIVCHVRIYPLVTLAGSGQSVHARVETGSWAKTGRVQLRMHMETPLCKPACCLPFWWMTRRNMRKTSNNCWQDSLGRAWTALLPITPGKQHPKWLHVPPMIIPRIWAIWISHQRCLLDGTPMDVLCNFPCGHSFACDGVKGRQDEARINRES